MGGWNSQPGVSRLVKKLLDCNVIMLTSHLTKGEIVIEILLLSFSAKL